MSIHAGDEFCEFYNFLTERITSGATNLSPEEAVDAWRAEHPLEDDGAETVVALRQAIQAMNAGDRGVTLMEFDEAFRMRHGLAFA